MTFDVTRLRSGGGVPARDPELAALLAETRMLTSKAFALSRSINDTIQELSEFSSSVLADRRARDPKPYTGVERRRHAR